MDPWKLTYCKQCVGVNQFKKFIPTADFEAGISGYTNHTLMATPMYDQQRGSEKFIANKSGYRILDELRLYTKGLSTTISHLNPLCTKLDQSWMSAL